MRKIVALFSVTLLLALVGGARAMPLRPDVVEKLRAENRLDEEKTFMEEAYSRGVNNPGLFGAPRVLGAGPAVMVMTMGKAVVLIVDFDDNVADTSMYPTSHYDDLLFSVDTYASGSMRDYYLENSYGDFDVTGEISGWHRMPQDYAYYVDGQRGF